MPEMNESLPNLSPRPEQDAELRLKQLHQTQEELRRVFRELQFAKKELACLQKQQAEIKKVSPAFSAIFSKAQLLYTRLYTYVR